MTGLIGVAVPLADTWGMHDGDVGGGWWILMVIGMVAFWGAVIWGIVWLTRGGLDRRGTAHRAPETPFETLDRRLAEGEISPEEYRERREILQGGHGRGGEGREVVPP